MSGSLTFHPASTEDIPLLQKLAGHVWRACYPGMISPEQIEYMLSRMYSSEAISNELAAGVHWEIARLDSTPAGYLAIAFHDPGDAELTKLYLDPQLHGHGHGQAMLAQAIAIAADRGCAELRLRVNKHNTRALRAYQRAGFSILEAVISDIGGGFVMDDYLLAKAIPSR